MADLICDLCEAEPAAALFTNLGNGDAQAIGGNCMIVFLLAGATELADSLEVDDLARYHELFTKLANRLGLIVEPPGVVRRAVTKPDSGGPKRRGRPPKKRPAPVDHGEQSINLPAVPEPVMDENPVTGDMKLINLADAAGDDA